MEVLLAGGLFGIAVIKHKIDKGEARKKKLRDLKYMRKLKQDMRKRGGE